MDCKTFRASADRWLGSGNRLSDGETLHVAECRVCTEWFQRRIAAHELLLAAGLGDVPSPDALEQAVLLRVASLDDRPSDRQGFFQAASWVRFLRFTSGLASVLALAGGLWLGMASSVGTSDELRSSDVGAAAAAEDWASVFELVPAESGVGWLDTESVGSGT